MQRYVTLPVCDECNEPILVVADSWSLGMVRDSVGRFCEGIYHADCLHKAMRTWIRNTCRQVSLAYPPQFEGYGWRLDIVEGGFCTNEELAGRGQPPLSKAFRKRREVV